MFLERQLRQEGNQEAKSEEVGKNVTGDGPVTPNDAMTDTNMADDGKSDRKPAKEAFNHSCYCE